MVGLFRASSAILADAQFPKYHLRRAESGDGGLDQIETHESREPQPIRMNPMRQGKACENERSSDDANS